MKIINENNENLLEKIYKNQTVSNFNCTKKESVKILFSLLKKYKYSEKDKNNLFLYYNKLNRNMKYNILYYFNLFLFN